MRVFTMNRMSLVAAGLAALCLAGSARAVEADPQTPADADVVVSVNVREVLDSELFKKYGKDDAQKALLDDKAKKMLDAIGLDPMKDVDSVLFTSAGVEKPHRLLVVHGHFEPARIEAAAEKYAKDHPDDLKITKKSDMTIYEGKGDGKQPFFAHVASNGKSVVASTDEDYLVQAVTTKSSGPGKNLTNALSAIDGKEAVWVAMVLTPEMRKVMESNPNGKELAPKLQAVTGTINVTNEVQSDFVIHTSDAKAAGDVKKLLNQVKPILTLAANSDEHVGPLVGDLMDNLKITTEKTNVNISLTVPADLIEKAAREEKKDSKEEKDK